MNEKNRGMSYSELKGVGTMKLKHHVQEKYWLERKGRAWVKVAKGVGASQELAEDSVRRLAMPARNTSAAVEVLERIPVFATWVVVTALGFIFNWPGPVIFGCITAGATVGFRIVYRYFFWTPKWLFKKRVKAVVRHERVVR